MNFGELKNTKNRKTEMRASTVPPIERFKWMDFTHASLLEILLSTGFTYRIEIDQVKIKTVIVIIIINLFRD